ncbi:MAG: lysine--tRNA ligase [Pseudomonadota bacterium]
MNLNAPLPAAIADNAKSWPFAEARALIKRLDKIKKTEGPVVFETGYGPSGLPHLGTFGEVARTTMVRRSFEALTGRPTRLIAFSDDLDGMRKVPPTVPNPEKLEPFLQRPLTDVPDPFGTHDSFAAHNNALLCKFLDQFGFDYEFMSSTDQYRSGVFNAMLVRMLECYDAVMDIILPTLGEERRATYSPFLPISPTTGQVLYVPVLERDAKAGTIVFEDSNGEKVKTTVADGAVKLQWKADWAGRWFALGVDYEMSGEDLTESVRLSNRIVKALGTEPPSGFNFQLFLDEQGQKISKTKGNGLSIDEWLTYASPESLSLYMFSNPKKAKKLYFDIIPKTADEYLAHLDRYTDQVNSDTPAKAMDNPVWHIHEGSPPAAFPPVTFALLLNLVSAASASDKDQLWGYLKVYRPGVSPENNPRLDEMVGYAIKYYERFVAPTKDYRAPTEQERAGLEDLVTRLRAMPETQDVDALQTTVFDAGKAVSYENLRQWFKGIYEVCFGQSEGPRMGNFIAIYGVKNTADMIETTLAKA